MSSQLRLSRFSYPRATWWVLSLLAIFFVVFGFYAEANLAQSSVPAEHFTNPGTTGWVGQFIDRVAGR